RVDVRTAAAWSALYHGDSDTARQLLELARDVSEGAPSSIMEIEIALANVALEEEEYEVALDHFTTAESIRSKHNWEPRWHVHHGRALAYWAINDLERAERAFYDAIEDIESTRRHLEKPSDRAVFVHD